MNNSEVVLQLLATSNKKICDDCLSKELQIKPRQQINQICNRAFKQNKIRREKETCDFCKKDKLISYC